MRKYDMESWLWMYPHSWHPCFALGRGSFGWDAQGAGWEFGSWRIRLALEDPGLHWFDTFPTSAWNKRQHVLLFTSQLYFISFVGLFEMHILLPLTLLAHMMMMMMTMTTMMMIFSLRVSGSCLLLLTHRHLQLGPGAPSNKREFTDFVFEF